MLLILKDCLLKDPLNRQSSKKCQQYFVKFEKNLEKIQSVKENNSLCLLIQ